MAKTVRMLTDRFIKNYTFRGQPGTRDEMWDEGQHGLILRCTEKNKKTFVLYAKFARGAASSRREVGDAEHLSLADARDKVRRWRELIAKGVDPRDHEEQQRQEERERRENTFGLVAKEWFRSIAEQRKAREVERDVRNIYFPEWEKKPITGIRSRDVRNLIVAVRDERGPAQAHNTLGYGRRLFDWAIEQEVYGIEHSPFERFRPRKLIGRKAIRQRVLSDAELRALWRAAGGTGYPFGSYVQMLALTGARKSEAGEARWSEFDLDKKVWTIPASRMKSNSAHVVPICDDLHALLASLPRFGGRDDFLFSQPPAPPMEAKIGKRGERLAPRKPRPRKTEPPRPGTVAIGGFSKSTDRLREAMASALDEPVENWTLHDIRRTFRTHLSALQISDRVAEQLLAHAQPGLHRVYDRHTYDEQKRAALEAWERRLRAIVGGQQSGNVVIFRGA